MIATIAPLLAGLGLFFSGVHFVSANLTPLAGKRFRHVLTRATTHPSLSALTGILAEQQMVLSMLGHRDELMERMRCRVLQENPDLPAESQESLFATTMLFERIVWLARRSALLIVPEAADVSTPAG